VLRRHELEGYGDEPEHTITALRELVQGTGGKDEIFALAELSLFRAQQERSATPHYLAAALSRRMPPASDAGGVSAKAASDSGAPLSGEVRHADG
jgi:hypothetical protein